MENNQYYYDAYFEFIKYADEKISELEKAHRKHISCIKGCSFCCMETTVLPIEFYSILSVLKEKNDTPRFTKNSCSLLYGSACQIYPLRPLICRTHGLALAYGDDDDPRNKNIFFCELNFKHKTPKFNASNSLDMDELNIELVRLNENFLKSFGEDLPDRIPLSKLSEYL